MAFLARLLILAVAILATSYILPGILVRNVLVAIIAALVLGLVNAFVKPILVVLTIPLTVFTLGLFLLILNALLLWLVAAIVDGFEITGFGWAFLGSIIISLISAGLSWLIKG